MPFVRAAAAIGLRYGLAVASPIAGVALCAALAQQVGLGASMLILLVAVMLVAWRGGFGPGLFATGLGMALTEMFLVAPRGPLVIAHTAEATRLAIFAVEGVVISLLGQALLQPGTATGQGPSRRRAPGSPALEAVARASAMAVLLMGLAVLAGWALNLSALKSVLPGLAPMHPGTALCFFFAGLALALARRVGVRQVCAGAMLLIASLSLVQDALGAGFNGELFAPGGRPGAETPGITGRMSSITAMSFLLFGVSLWLLGTRQKAARRTLEAMALAGGALALLALIGYLYSVATLFAVPGLGGISIHTALGFTLLAMGILCAHADGLASVFGSDGPGGQVARRFLPLAIAAPVVIGRLVQMGEEAGLFSSTQDTAVFAASMVLVLPVFVWRNALSLESGDAERLRAEELQRSVVEAAPNGMLMVDGNGTITLVNGAMERLFGYARSEMVGQPVEMFVPQYLRKSHRVQRAGFIAHPHDRAMGAGQDLYGLRKDGSGFPLEIGLSAVRTLSGPCVLASVIDITARKQVEGALREREAAERARRAETEALMAAIPAAVFIAHDAACEQITGNPAAVNLLRRTPGRNTAATALEGEHYQSWSRGRQLTPGELPMQRAAASGQPVSDAEVDVVFADGETRNLLGAALPLFDDAGAVRGCVGAFMDITERKRRERNLMFLADMQKVIAPITSDTDLMRVVSERIAGHLKLRRCMLVEIDQDAQQATVLYDHHAGDMPSLVGVYALTEFRNEAERKELAAGRTLVTHNVRDGARADDEVQRMESRGIRSLVSAPYVADGRWKFLLSAQRGEPHAWSAEDVELLNEMAARVCVRVERARGEQRLVESEERIRLAAEAARFGMFDRDLNGAFFHVSPQLKQMLGYPPDAMLDHDQVMSHIHPDDREAGEAAFQHACDQAGDGRINIEQRIVRRDGVVRWVATVGQLLFRDGVPARSLGFWVDVTDHKEAEAVLRRRNKELRAAAEVALASKYKSEFLANMSHELRTPLNSLLILSRLLADNRDGNLSARQVEYAVTIHQSGADLLELINEILDLSKIEAGQMAVGIEAIPIADLAARIERDFRHVAQARQLDFSVNLAPGLSAEIIRSDGRRLQQLLKNLLSNAFKFTEKGGVRLDIGVATDGWSRPHPMLDQASGVVTFAVTDSGIGIAPDKQQLIFEAFAQADGTTTRKYGGTGLGLSISREIASLLGGAIVLKSRPGEGSTFTLYLPRSYAPKGTDPARAVRRKGRPAKNHHPVAAHRPPGTDDRLVLTPDDDLLLVVENDASFARLLMEIAHRHGFKVLLAASVTAAQQLARQFRPMAITLSVSLTDMDGWQLLDRLKDDLDIRHIPVHIISGEDERPRGLRRGAVSYLQKPATERALGDLFKRIRATRERSQALLLVVEDDPVQQQQILEAIGSSDDLRATVVASAEEALAQLRAHRFDCVVLDLRLPQMTGLEFLEAVRDQLHIDDLPIVVYTGMDLSPQQQTRLNRLAETVLLKDARSTDQLLEETSFYLHRPVAALPAPAREVIARLHAGARPLAGRKVLVVDDDMRNVFAVLAILEAEGVDVRHADNGKQCLEMLEQTPDFDAVLMDIMMPVMDGYETMRRLRQVDGLKTLPVIALTAKVMKGDRDKCMAAGASDYLAKPVDAGQLVALLQRWVK